MRTTVVLLSLVAAIAAEAPYNLPRPSAQAPAFNYPSAPAPAPAAPAPQLPIVQANSNQGYQYQQPSIAPAYVQPAVQQAAPQQIQLQQQIQPQQQSGYFYSQPHTQPQADPSPQPQPTFAPQPQPIQPQPAPIQYYQQSQPSGYNYQQPQVRAQPQSSLQFNSANSFSSSQPSLSLSSYQADNNQYSGLQQIRSDGLDSTVIERVQNILRDNEQNAARSAGYSVSGVYLDNALPSIEVSSFVDNSPIAIRTQSSSQRTAAPSFTSTQYTSGASSGSSAPSGSYGLPEVIANSAISQPSLSVLPQQPRSSYVVPL